VLNKRRCHLAVPLTFKYKRSLLRTVGCMSRREGGSVLTGLWPHDATIPVTLHDPQLHHKVLPTIQKSIILRILHITSRPGCPPALFHPSVQRLTLVYHDIWNASQLHSLEEVRLPRLQGLTVDIPDPKLLVTLRLVETPVLSLGLICRFHCSHGLYVPEVKTSWAGSVICLLPGSARWGYPT
jgi:hypothetical protein